MSTRPLFGAVFNPMHDASAVAISRSDGEMVRLDVRYAKTRSFWTDVKILLGTPAAVIVGKGAA